MNRKKLKEAYHEYGGVLCDKCNSKVDFSEAQSYGEAVELWRDHVTNVHEGKPNA